LEATGLALVLVGLLSCAKKDEAIKLICKGKSQFEVHSGKEIVKTSGGNVTRTIEFKRVKATASLYPYTINLVDPTQNFGGKREQVVWSVVVDGGVPFVQNAQENIVTEDRTTITKTSISADDTNLSLTYEQVFFKNGGRNYDFKHFYTLRVNRISGQFSSSEQTKYFYAEGRLSLISESGTCEVASRKF